MKSNTIDQYPFAAQILYVHSGFWIEPARFRWSVDACQYAEQLLNGRRRVVQYNKGKVIVVKEWR